jgi:hypothetical protein
VNVHGSAQTRNEGTDMSEDRPWYDLAAFGAKTGLGRTMVWQLRREGKIRVVRVGRRVFVPASELERFVSAVEADTDFFEAS